MGCPVIFVMLTTHATTI